MSEQNWKYGDTALVTCSDSKERIALYGTRWIDDSGVWLFPDKTMRDVDNSDARPLVVIDPEDTDSLMRLSKAYHAKRSFGATQIEALQLALREFANPTPPKPAEPTGLGAVVEDAGGVRWVKVFDNGSMWQDNRDRGEWRGYKDIAAVKVLSEGVTA